MFSTHILGKVHPWCLTSSFFASQDLCGFFISTANQLGKHLKVFGLKIARWMLTTCSHISKIWWMREQVQKTRSECLQVFDHHETLLKGHWVHGIWQNLDNSGFSSTKMMHLGNRIFSSYFLKGLSIWCISHLQLLHPPEHGWTRWGVTRWLQWLHFVNQTIGCLPPPRSRIIIHRPIDPSSLKDVCSLQRP